MKWYSKWVWALLVVGIAAILVWIWPREEAERLAPGGGPLPAGSSLGSPSGVNGGLAHPGKRPRKDSKASDTDDAGSPEVNRILTDTAINNGEAVAKLRELAADKSLRVGHRLEALTHGLNLDPAAFAGLSEDPDLPGELADTLLSAMINFNEAPALQIEVYMNLTQHADSTVAATAKEMLAFRVGDEQEALDVPALLREGRKQIVEIRKSTGSSADSR